MNRSKYYIHATGGYLGLYNSHKNILKILRSGEIKSFDDKGVCLCDPTKSSHVTNDLKSSYKLFVMWGPAIFLNKNINVQEPTYGDNINSFTQETDLCDEVISYDNISLEKIEFITFPIPNDYFLKKVIFKDPYTGRLFIRDYIKELSTYKEIIENIKKKYPNIPIKNLYTGKYIDDCELIKARISILKKDL